MSSQGLNETASVLSKEASLALMTSKQLTHKMTTPTPTQNIPRSSVSVATPTSSSTPLKLANINFKPQTAMHPTRTVSPRNNHSHMQAIPTPGTPTSSREPLNIKLKRKEITNTPNNLPGPSVTSVGAKSVQKIYDVKNYLDTLPELYNEEGAQRINLVSIGNIKLKSFFCILRV